MCNLLPPKDEEKISLICKMFLYFLMYTQESPNSR